MNKLSFATLIALGCSIFIFSECNENKSNAEGNVKDSTAVSATTGNGGFGNQVKWGEHLVAIIGCNDCHTTKKMGPRGPEPDLSLLLSGHPSAMPALDVNRKDLESKGIMATGDLTEFVGPWGVSYAANLTSDSTGLGNWKEDQFIYCMRHGKWMGSPDSRDLLPPMPWQNFAQMSDDELKAMFAYLKSTQPIHNIVPVPEPPVSAMKN